MPATTGAPLRLDAGRVARSTLQVLGRDWPAFLVLGLLCSFAPRLLARWIVFQPQVAALGQGSLLGRAAISGALMMLVELLPAALLVGLIAVRTAGVLGRASRPFSACLTEALHRLPLLAAASLVLNLGVTLGLVLLIVPGALVMLAWCVALPVAALEPGPLTSAFRRSAELTRGHRGAILLLALACGLAAVVAAVAAGVGLSLVAEPLRNLVPEALAAGDPAVVLGGALGAMIGAVLTAAGAAALYHELRQLKDGGGAQNLAAVFE